MKFNLNFINFKKLYIYFCFLAVLNIFFSTNKVDANSFSINDIEISTPFEIDFNKNQIIDKGFFKAFNQLIITIIQTKDQKKLENISLASIKGMIETFSITEEKFINEIYYLTLNVSFKKKEVLSLLEKKNIFATLPIKKDVLFIPIIFDQNQDDIYMFSESYLFNNWNSKVKKHHLLNYILPAEDLEDFNLIKSNSSQLENYDFKKIIKKYDLEDFIIMIIFKNGKEIKILNKINFNNKIDLKNFKYQNLSLNNEKEYELLIENFKNKYENYWKSKNEVNTSIKLNLTISIDNNDNQKILKFEEILSNIDLIYNFNIFRINNKSNIYKITFNGSPDYFINIMKDKNYQFDRKNQIWILK